MQLKVSLLTVNCFFFFFYFFFFLFLLFLFFFFFSFSFSFFFFFFFFYFSFLFFLSFSQILVKLVIYLLNMYFLYLPRQWSLNWSLHPHSISLVLRSSFSLIKNKGKKDIFVSALNYKICNKVNFMFSLNSISPLTVLLPTDAQFWYQLTRPATIHFSTIRYVSQYSCHDMIHDTIHNNKTRRVLPCVLLVGSEVCTADWKHACVCCVRYLEYNTKHCSAWIFLLSLFGKSPCIRTKKRKEGEH